MHKLANIFFVLGGVVSGPLFAQGASEAKGFTDSAEGVVVVTGSAANAQTKLSTRPGSSEGVAVCRSGNARRLGKVSGMTVAADGVWSQNPVSKEKCLEVKNFRIKKTSSGRDALVGKLLKREAQFFVETDDGKEQSLSSVPPGLSKLEGKQVIIDVKPLDSPSANAAGGKSWRVVSYSEHP